MESGYHNGCVIDEEIDMNPVHQTSATRGFGFLEGFLANRRTKMANQLIHHSYRGGRLLDIGCGVHPYFLSHTEFSEKYGVDQVVRENYSTDFTKDNMNLIHFDIHNHERLPFKCEFFDVVTMLAVFEHIESQRIPALLSEIYRVLRPGGLFVMTTPAAWTDYLLRSMAKIRLVSPVEIEDHKDTYTQSKISRYLEESHFRTASSRMGYFEFYMNIWLASVK